MSIRETLIKIKGAGEMFERRDVLAVFLIIFVGFSSFFLGKLSVKTVPDEPVTISTASVEGEVKGLSVEMKESAATTKPSSVVLPAEGQYVGSKNSQVYHLPWCSGALRISEANKVWFSSKADAEAKGYRPAANCKGI